MNFKRFLVMEALGNLSKEDQDALKTIIQKVQAKDKSWFDQQSIDVGLKEPYWVLNYIQGAPVNQYSLLTRGLIINQNTGQIVSMPFKRFGNIGEDIGGYKSTVDFSKSEVLEKLDGSMVGVAFPDRNPSNPIWHTRKMVSTHDLEAQIERFGTKEKMFFMKEVGNYVKKLRFTPEDTNNTWIFEFIGEEKPVITVYKPEQFGLYLIGARNLETFEEYSEDELDEMAQKIGAKRPKRWGIKGSQAEIKAMMGQFADDFEGFVLRQTDTGQRGKMKRAEYLKRHRLLGRTNYKNLIPIWIDGETSEVTTYFPETKEKFERIVKSFKQRVKELVDAAKHYKSKFKDKKSLAFGMQEDKVDRVTKSFVFATFGEPEEELEKIIGNKIKDFWRVGQNIDKVQELLGLYD